MTMPRFTLPNNRKSAIKLAAVFQAFSWLAYFLVVILVALAGIFGWLLGLLLMIIAAVMGLISWIIMALSGSLRSPEGVVALGTSILSWGGGILVELFLAWPTAAGQQPIWGLWGLVPLMIGLIPAGAIFVRAWYRVDREFKAAKEAYEKIQEEARRRARGEEIREVVEVNAIIEVVE